MDTELNGTEKAAIFLLSLNEDLASEILKHLGPSEVQRVSSEMARLDTVPQNRLIKVAEEFEQVMGSSISFDGSRHVKKVLQKALGSDRADALLDQVMEDTGEGGFDALKWMEPKIVAEIIKNEHPQTIAVIVSQLEPKHASKVISLLPEGIRSDVIMRVATMESISRDAIKELEETIKQQLSSNQSIHNKEIGGIKTAAEILNQMDTASETSILSEIEKANEELAQEIQKEMFVFADLINADDRGVQMLLREVSSDQLAIALKAADDALKEKIFKNMSERARDMLKEDIETRGPMKLSEVEKVQQEIIAVARRLEQEGKLFIEGKGGGDALV